MRDPDDGKDEAAESPPLDDEPTRSLTSPLPGKRGAELGRPETSFPALEHRYEILGEAGRGGMGVVYRARDRETNESVALKVLKPEIAADAAFIERFKNELKLARKVTHKNVCRIHEFNRAADGSAYISMELVDGDSLRRILGRFGGVPLRKGIQVARQICAGLSEAHAQGVVHRDLKPENIMLDQAGNVKIMDFGIARSLEAATGQTTGVIGTPAYMAPEQAEGKKTDHRADIYSLGLILYEMFTGAAAVSGQTPVEMALKQIHETPTAPRAVEPTLPAYIEKAILKCLEKNTAKRFQSVDQLDAALTRQEEEKPVVAEGGEVTMPPRLAFWQRSDWWLLGSALLGVILFFPLFYRFHPAPALEITGDAEQARKAASEALKKLGWDGEAEKPRLAFDPRLYFVVASNLGTSAVLNDPQVKSRFWEWSGKLNFQRGNYARGEYEIGPKGELRSIDRLPVVSPSLRLPDVAEMAQMKEVAQNALKSVYGQDALAGELTKRSIPAFTSFRWSVTGGSGGYSAESYAQFAGREVTSLGRRLDISRGLWERFWGRDFEIVPRSLLVAPVLALFAMVLFLLRKLYRQPRSWPNLCLAAFAALGFAIVFTVLRGRAKDSTEIPLNIVLPLASFCINLLLWYAVLNTALYYLRSRFPERIASYLLLFRENVLARGTGLALLRGIFAGFAFSGFWMAALSFAGVRGTALPAMIAWLELFGDHSPFSARVFPVMLIAEVLMVGWLLIALPLSLLGRVSSRPLILLPALTALWLGFGFSLAGPMVFPRLPYYVLAVVQAVFFGAIFLRYDLLTTLSALFTMEVCLLAFPYLETFQQIDPVPYLIPIGLWAVLFLAGAGLYLRPQLVASYRRVAAVFE